MSKPTGSPEPELARMARECIAVRARLISRVITSLYDDVLRPYNLKISQGNLLVALASVGEVRPVDLSRALKLERSTLSRDVEFLKSAGWVVSDPPGGGRNQRLRLTPAGLALVREALPAWEKAQTEAARLLQPDGVEALHRIAARLGFPGGSG